jgi:hypothetical protein
MDGRSDRARNALLKRLSGLEGRALRIVTLPIAGSLLVVARRTG